MFADDCSLNSPGPEDMLQHSLDLFSTVCTNFRLTISTNKTGVMYQSASGKQYQEPAVRVNGQSPSAVEKFTLLSSILFGSVHIDSGTGAMIAAASLALDRLH